MPKLLLSGSIEENIVTALCHHQLLASTVLTKITPDLFSTRILREIAEIAIKYIKEYRKPPGVHIRDLLEDLLRRTTEEGRYANIVVDTMDRLAPALNEDYVLSELDKFVVLRKMSMDVETASRAIEKGNLTAAGEAFASGHATFAEARGPRSLLNPWADPVAPPFPSDALPDVVRKFVEKRARVISAPDQAPLAFSTLSACGAAIHGMTRLQMHLSSTSWREPPCLWVALVGNVSAKKSPLLLAPWNIMAELQAAERKKWRAACAEWRKSKDDNKGDEPKCLRIITNSATFEGLRDVLQHQHQDRGIGIPCDELKGFIGSFDRFSGSNSGGAERALFLQAYQGGPFAADRAKGNSIIVDNMLATVCGGIQWTVLRSLKDITDDGLWQRFIPVITPPAEVSRDLPDGPEVDAFKNMLRQRIENPIYYEPGENLVLSLDAADIRERLEREAKKLMEYAEYAISPAFAGFIGKLVAMWGRLCLILSIVERPQSWRITKDIAERARALVFDCAYEHGRQVYQTMDGGCDDVTKDIAGHIISKKKTRLLRSDLTSDVRLCRGNSEEDIRRKVSPLVAGGWLTPEQDRDATAWRVDPAVHDLFRERAISETVRRAVSYEGIKEKARQNPVRPR